MSAAMISGFGQFHTDEPDAKSRRPYNTITWPDIVALVDKPQRVPKAQAQWLIPSTLMSRKFSEQEVRGQFHMLWADLDKSPAPMQRVVEVLTMEIIGGADFEVYSSRSATVDCPKARILIPLSQPLSGSDWALVQEVLNDELHAKGIHPDRASQRTGQLCYLPNAGEHYEKESQRDGKRFDALASWAEKIAAKRQSVALAAEAMEAQRMAAARRKATLAAHTRATGRPSLIEAFCEAYSVVDILLQAGYRQRGNTFCHPASESGSYSAGVKDGRVHSLSSSDPLYTGGAGGGAHDAFSAFEILMHSGDHEAALRDAGDHWLTIGAEPWNVITRREWAQMQPQKPCVDGRALTHDDRAPHPLAQFVQIDAQPRAPKWVIPGFIGHGLVAIAGSQNVGKTTTLLPLAMVAAGLHGDACPLAPSHWRHVVYVTEDIDQAHRIVAGVVNFGSLGLRLDVVCDRLHLVEARRLSPGYVVQVARDYRAQFTRTVDGVEVLPLVVFDTKSSVFAQEDENSNTEASAIVALLKQEFQGLPAWVIGHLAKANATRTDVASLSMRGGSAFECDANQVLFLVKEGEARYLLRGKTRFEPWWPELRVDGHSAQTKALNEFGAMERVTLRWSIASPAEETRREAQEQAQEAARKADAAELRDEVRNAIQTAWETGFPLNREGVKAKVKRKRQEVTDTIEDLLSERWLYEVGVPTKERTNPNRGTFLVNLTTEEHEALLRGENLPATKLEVPMSWRKPAAPSVPENEEPGAPASAIAKCIGEIPSVPIPSVPLRKTTCGTDGRELESPRPSSVPDEAGTDKERTGADGNGRADLPHAALAEEIAGCAPVGALAPDASCRGQGVRGNRARAMAGEMGTAS